MAIPDPTDSDPTDSTDPTDPSGSSPIDLASLEGLDDVSLALALVSAAGELAARMRAEGMSTEFKTSVSDVVSAADRAAEELVMTALRHCRPDDGIVGEEGANHAGGSGREWVIDPVDGTYNFLSGMHYWCSALALRSGSDALIGAVHQPATDETWVAAPGQPTRLNGIPVPGLVDRPLAEVSLATYLHPGSTEVPAILEPTLAMIRAVATPRILGSGSIDLAGVASGRIGVWAQRETADWDWYPGQALVRGAGGLAEVVHHRGVRWHLAGNPQSVAELTDVLLDS